MDPNLKPVRHSAVMAGASPAEVFAVVVDFPAYPRLFPEIKQARVLRSQAGKVRAEFRGNLVLPFRYVLDLDCNAQAGTVTWTYVEGELVKNSTGGWGFVAEAGGTRVEYEVALRIEAPVPGFLLRKITDGLVTLSLPAMFASIEREIGRRR
ncbi:MAG TPA: SRPBCC family protein [Polyangia bacterium]|jgi:Polyketide cyclase / dehydrase and lipid transport.|nr:SRPBCC family protein [Polyangia bacterium]